MAEDDKLPGLYEALKILYVLNLEHLNAKTAGIDHPTLLIKMGESAAIAGCIAAINKAIDNIEKGND